jgi:hypothetical protein
MTDLERSMMTWRWVGLIVYLILVVYDFLVVPVWYGLSRPDISSFMEIINNSNTDTIVKMELMKKLTAQHSPFTLMNGGLLHLTFLSILTASTIGINKK